MPETRKAQYAGSAAVLIAGWAAAFLPLAYFVFSITRTTGSFTYPLDDAYIHMEIARNIAQTGTWGVNPGTFGSASSSILYTLLLSAVFGVAGVNAWVPLVINIVAGALLVGVTGRWLLKQGLSPLAAAILLVAIVLLLPLPVLMFSGMEHVLQCLFAFLLLTGLSRWLDEGRRGFLPPALLLWAALLASIRYEGLFLLAVTGLTLLLRRDWKAAASLALAGGLPLIIFGAWSVAQGGYFLPNSVLVKSETAAGGGGGPLRLLFNALTEKLSLAKGGITAVATQRLLLLLPLVWLLFRGRPGASPGLLRLTAWAAAAVLIHLTLATTGWFYRYEAYLVLVGLLPAAVLLWGGAPAWWRSASLPVRLAGAALAFYLLLPMLLRTSAGLTKAVQAAKNIHDQQRQMAAFLGAHYPGGVVAANDIGAIAFFPQTKVVDLWGLGNGDVARARKEGHWTPQFLDSLVRAQGADLAIVYDTWFSEELLQRWHKAGTWTITNNVICGDDDVHFYTLDSTRLPQLRARLDAFRPNLPKDVAVHITGEEHGQ